MHVRHCGVEQRQLVGLITRRSQVRILSPLFAKSTLLFWVLFFVGFNVFWRRKKAAYFASFSISCASCTSQLLMALPKSWVTRFTVTRL